MSHHNTLNVLIVHFLPSEKIYLKLFLPSEKIYLKLFLPSEI